jgi:ElaB/YqjD/DUF883 family membrane-anchored ribosome-binding protein
MATQKNASIRDSIDESVEDVRSNVQHLTQDIRHRAETMAQGLSERAGEYYEDAQEWMNENSTRVFAVVGILAAVGVAGYLLARGSSRGERRLPAKRTRIA